MSGGQAVAARMKHQGLTVCVLVVFHLAKEDHMVAAIVLAHISANEVRIHPREQGHSSRTFDELNSGKFVGQRGGKLAREMVLVGGQDVDGNVCGMGEIGKAGGLPR